MFVAFANGLDTTLAEDRAETVATVSAATISSDAPTAPATCRRVHPTAAPHPFAGCGTSAPDPSMPTVSLGAPP